MTKWHFFGNLSTSDNTAQQPSLIRSMSNALKLHGGMYETGIFDLIYSFQSIFPDRVSQIWPDTHSGIKTLGEHFSLKGCKWVGWSQAWKCKCLNLTFNENCLRNTSVLTQCTNTWIQRRYKRAWFHQCSQGRDRPHNQGQCRKRLACQPEKVW